MKYTEELRSQMNVNETDKPESTILNREKIEGTPFYLIETDIGSFIVMGSHRISEIHKTPAKALEELDNQNWMIIMRMIGIIHEEIAKNAISNL